MEIFDRRFVGATEQESSGAGGTPAITEFHKLLTLRSDICVSIYMPTHRVRLEKHREDKLRLKNLLGEANEKLSEFAPQMTVPERAKFLEPATKLTDDSLFWKQQLEGLALFLSRDMARLLRLPLQVPACVAVGSRPYIRPLLPLLTRNGRYYILALSLNAVRLFECTADNVVELALTDTPTSMSEALADDDPERTLQYHTGTGASSRHGRQTAVYHGQNVANEKKSNIERYFRLLDVGLQQQLPDATAPLVLAGVDYLMHIFQDVSEHPVLLLDGISGSPQNMDSADLHSRASQIVRAHFQAEEHRPIARYGDLLSTQLVAEDADQILKAAEAGRVETLFVNAAAPLAWQDKDALEVAARRTLLKGGDVYVLAADEMPADSEMAAILRY